MCDDASEDVGRSFYRTSAILGGVVLSRTTLCEVIPLCVDTGGKPSRTSPGNRYSDTAMPHHVLWIPLHTGGRHPMGGGAASLSVYLGIRDHVDSGLLRFDFPVSLGACWVLEKSSVYMGEWLVLICCLIRCR